MESRHKLELSLKGIGIKSRASQLKIKYGVTVEWYENQFIEQKGKCAICGMYQDSIKYALCVDHDHKTGRARGLLCTNCNSAIGYFKDNIDNILSSVTYLEKYKHLTNSNLKP